jgi:hypothetical protein
MCGDSDVKGALGLPWSAVNCGNVTPCWLDVARGVVLS